MPLFSEVNQFFGVNPHLLSYFQAHGGWDSFHGNYIVKLAEFINAALPPGYFVDIEQSLQIRVSFADPDREDLVRNYRPDVAVYERTTSPTEQSFAYPGEATATLVQPIAATFDDVPENYYQAVVVYNASAPGEPTTRIELLSPSNKRGAGLHSYVDKRIATLKSNTNLVEVDFLHETLSPVIGVPRYPHDGKSQPYTITVNIPEPDYRQGRAYTYSFAVDVPVPTLQVPIGVGQTIAVDFDVVFQHTFASLSVYAMRVDYEQLPENLNRYSAADRERIRKRVELVREKSTAGLSLDDGPFVHEDEA